MMGVVTSAAEKWRSDLEAWAVPRHILAAAPESPWGCPPGMFAASAAAAAADPADTPSRAAALEALGGGGTILDVGVGGGAASIALCPPGTWITGVDESTPMLEAFE